MLRFLFWILLFAGSVYIMNTQKDTEILEHLKSGYDWWKKNIQIEPACAKPLIKQPQHSTVSQNNKDRWRY